MLPDPYQKPETCYQTPRTTPKPIPHYCFFVRLPAINTIRIASSAPHRQRWRHRSNIDQHHQPVRQGGPDGPRPAAAPTHAGRRRRHHGGESRRCRARAVPDDHRLRRTRFGARRRDRGQGGGPAGRRLGRSQPQPCRWLGRRRCSGSWRSAGAGSPRARSRTSTSSTVLTVPMSSRSRCDSASFFLLVIHS
jgi:hypothetical protein